MLAIAEVLIVKGYVCGVGSQVPCKPDGPGGTWEPHGVQWKGVGGPGSVLTNPRWLPSPASQNGA